MVSPTASPSLLPLFVFGTLKDPDIFHLVVGQKAQAFTISEAIYPDHAVLREKTEAYPVLAERIGLNAPGLLIRGLDAAQIDRIQFFESIEYELCPMTVMEQGQETDASCFIATELLSCEERPWHIEDWIKADKPQALLEAELLMALYGRIAREDVEDHWPAIVAEARRLLDCSSKTG